MALCISKSPTHFRIQQSQSLLFLNSYKLTIFIFVLCPFASSTSFEFSNFQPTGQLITYEGDGVAANIVIELTNARGSSGSVGRASYKDPVQLWDSKTGKLTDFSTFFCFIVTPSNHSYSRDGLTFSLCPHDDPIPANTPGVYIGLLNETTNNQIVAVEFDAYQDSWDPSHHIGIDASEIASKTYCNLSDIMPNGTTANAWLQRQDQGGSQGGSHEINTNTSAAGAIGNRNGAMGSTNTGGDVNIYNSCNVVLPPKAKGVLEKKA